MSNRHWAGAALLAAMAGTSAANAQTSLSPAPAAEPPPLEFAIERGRMTVPVHIGDAGPFAFVVDTGAERTVISRELATKLRLAASGRARLFDFVGVSDVGTVRMPKLAIGDVGAPASDAPMLELAHIGASGMLGIDALQGRKLSIDFARQRMAVIPSRRHVRGEIVVRAQERSGQLIITKASFEGQPIAVIVDTGSWLSIGNSAMLALAKRTPRRVGPISVTSVTGRSFDTDLVAVNALTIGKVKLNNVGVSFADVAPFERFGLRDTPALILGMSTLRLFWRIEMDFANREIAFTLPRPPIDFRVVCRAFSSCKTLY